MLGVTSDGRDCVILNLVVRWWNVNGLAAYICSTNLRNIVILIKRKRPVCEGRIVCMISNFDQAIITVILVRMTEAHRSSDKWTSREAAGKVLFTAYNLSLLVTFWSFEEVHTSCSANRWAFAFDGDRQLIDWRVPDSVTWYVPCNAGAMSMVLPIVVATACELA